MSRLSKLPTALLLPLVLAMATSLHAAEYIGKIKADKILVTTTAGNGQHLAYLQTDRPEVTAMTVEIPPGADTGWHLHSFPVYAYVLAGTLKVEIADGTTLSFQQGDAIVEVQNLGHNGFNRGSEPCRLAVFYTGEVGRPLVTKVKPPASTP